MATVVRANRPTTSDPTDSNHTNQAGKFSGNGIADARPCDRPCWTRPRLLVSVWSPRRNRTGDPILTMNLAAALGWTSFQMLFSTYWRGR